MSMFLNYIAGVASLVMAASAFVPWVTVWFYSIKGIESIYGLIVLVMGLIGVTLSALQHLSGRIRGRWFVVYSIIALASEVVFFRRLESYGQKLNEMVQLVKDLFGDAVVQKLQQLLGEQWMKIISKLIEHFSTETSLSGYNFMGGGLFLAFGCSVVLLVVGVLLEKYKQVD